MPNYDYRCNICHSVWEEQRTIADRDTPLSTMCPWCFNKDNEIERIPGAPGVSYTVFGARSRAPETFKDVLRKIKKNNRGSTIEV